MQEEKCLAELRTWQTRTRARLGVGKKQLASCNIRFSCSMLVLCLTYSLDLVSLVYSSFFRRKQDLLVGTHMFAADCSPPAHPPRTSQDANRKIGARTLRYVMGLF